MNQGKRGRPQTKNPPPENPNDPRSRKIVLDNGASWIESVEAPVEMLAYADVTPPGFVKLKGPEGVYLVRCNVETNPVLKMATTGRRRLTKVQIDAGYRLMSDFAVMNASTSNTDAVIRYLENAPVISTADKRAAETMLERGTGYGIMASNGGTKPPKDYAHAKLDAALRLNRVRKAMSRVGWKFVEAMCQYELSVDRIAVLIDEPVAYCDVRAREALSELAAAYVSADATPSEAVKTSKHAKNTPKTK